MCLYDESLISSRLSNIADSSNFNLDKLEALSLSSSRLIDIIIRFFDVDDIVLSESSSIESS